MNKELTKIKTDTDFSFAVERQDRRRYIFNRGKSTLNTVYESASTSKLVSAVIILRLVERGYLKLSDRPQKYIDQWPIGKNDPLRTMTLAQLLSFTSGLESKPLCLNSKRADFERCVRKIAKNNAGNGVTPGQRYYYSGTHLQVAGLMAIKARGAKDWQEVFSEFQSQTKLFQKARYDLPSATNPRLGGGMHWTGIEYLTFLKALRSGALLNSRLMKQLLKDQTAAAVIAYSPAFESLGEQWHYGFGLWQECRSPTYNCVPGSRVSSPGAYGAYPFWDREKHYLGIVARQGRMNSYVNGVKLERSVRPLVEKWAACL